MTDDTEIETAALDQAAETLTAGSSAVIDKLSAAAQDTGTTITDAIPSAIVGAIDRLVAQGNRQIQLIEAMQAQNVEVLNGLSRAQSNTDISAQQAAEGVEVIKEAITPPKETAPDSGEHPANIKELPVKDDPKQHLQKDLLFGKAAERHARR